MKFNLGEILKSKLVLSVIITSILALLQFFDVFILPDVIYAALVTSGLLLDFRHIQKKRQSKGKSERKAERQRRRTDKDNKKRLKRENKNLNKG